MKPTSLVQDLSMCLVQSLCVVFWRTRIRVCFLSFGALVGYSAVRAPTRVVAAVVRMVLVLMVRTLVVVTAAGSNHTAVVLVVNLRSVVRTRTGVQAAVKHVNLE